MPVLYETDLRVGPTISESYLLGDFESPYPLNSKLQVHTRLFHFEGKKDISSPYLIYASLVETRISTDPLEDVLNIHGPSIHLVFLEETKESK